MRREDIIWHGSSHNPRIDELSAGGGARRITAPSMRGGMRCISAVELARARGGSVGRRGPATTEQLAQLVVEVAVAVTCELVVGTLAHLLVQDTACLPNAGKEQALAHEGCGEVCQAAKQGSPVVVHAPKRAGYERPHAAQVVEAPQKGTIALGGVVPSETPLEPAEFALHLTQRGQYSP
jgi:hypothetical protein